MVNVRKDLTGMTFGRLTVLKQTDDYIFPSGVHCAQWLCECSCEEHNQVVVLGGNLGKHTNSCGCLVTESVSSRMKKDAKKLNKEYKHKVNKYDLTGKFGIGWTYNTKNEFYFDLEDYDKIKDYCWNEHILSGGYHVLDARIPDSNTIIRMGWIIAGKNYDHADRNPLNNRKSNLRPATKFENAQNHNKRIDNTSGVTGVTFNKNNNTWISRIQVNGKRMLTGIFADKEDAIISRLDAEQKYYGKFAPQKHLFQKYGIEVDGDGCYEK